MTKQFLQLLTTKPADFPMTLLKIRYWSVRVPGSFFLLVEDIYREISLSSAKIGIKSNENNNNERVQTQAENR